MIRLGTHARLLGAPSWCRHSVVEFDEPRRCHTPAVSGWLDQSLKSPEQGAATTVWAAVAKCLEGDGGKYLDDVQIAGPWTPDQSFALPGWASHAHDEAREGRLWKLSLDMAGLRDDN